MRPQATTSDERKWLGFIPGVLWIDFISEVPDISTGFSEYNSKSFTMAFSHAIYNHNIYELTKGRENKHILSYNLSKIMEEQMPQCLESLYYEF